LQLLQGEEQDVLYRPVIFPEEATISCNEDHSLYRKGCVGDAKEPSSKDKYLTVSMYLVILEADIYAR
jgi:hypothetical protein